MCPIGLYGPGQGMTGDIILAAECGGTMKGISFLPYNGHAFHVKTMRSQNVHARQSGAARRDGASVKGCIDCVTGDLAG